MARNLGNSDTLERLWMGQPALRWNGSAVVSSSRSVWATNHRLQICSTTALATGSLCPLSNQSNVRQ